MKTLDPDRIHLRAAPAALPTAAINAQEGTIKGISLLTAGREATGYGIWIDQTTLATFQTLLQGRRLKAYATHDSGIDGTLEEVGFWENPRIDGNQLRADFTALDAWRKFQPDEFATLFELAAKLPDEFGASLSFRFTLAWVCRAGADVPTDRTFSITGANLFVPPMPADALRAMPSVRALEVYSCDFVDQPAANSGLFSTGVRTAQKGLGKPESYEAALTRKLATEAAHSARPIEYPGKGTLSGISAAEACLAQKLKEQGDFNRPGRLAVD
jgi:hypothetical protein